VFGVPVPENVARELDDRVLEPASRAHERDATLARVTDRSEGAIHVAVRARRRNQETAVRGELRSGIVADRLGWHPLEPEAYVGERVVREQMRGILRIEIADDRDHGPHLRGVMVAYGAVRISRHEEDAMLAIWVKVRVKPDQRQRFLKAIEVDALGSERDEAGCLRFNVLQDAQDQNVYYFYEIYKDEAALEAHRAAPHYAVWRAAADTLDGPTEPTRCQPVFPADRAYWGKM
jgi:autoinducer 2-degrading protein